jgi:ribosome-associated translation inhibitor RaiA
VNQHTFPVHVRSRWLDYSPALHNHTRTRVDAALRAHGSRVKWVRVRISGGEGASEERLCEIEVAVKPDAVLTVSAADVDAYRATDTAIRRARTAVRRHVDRTREELRRAA